MSEAMQDEIAESSSGFSFLSATAAAEGEEVPESSTGFSFLSQAQAQSAEEERNQELQTTGVSGFGFLQESAPEIDSSASGFGFLASGSEPQPEMSSGFGFLSNANEAAPQATSDNGGLPSSGFSFLSAPSVEAPQPDHHHQAPMATQPSDHENSVQEIKLGKTASSKVVKKKKRAPKVGYARDEGDDDDVPSAPVSNPPSVESEPTQNPNPTAPEPSIPQPLEEDSRNSAQLQPETSVTTADPISTSSTPAYILRKEEIMSRANGARTPTKVDPQRRDSRTSSDAPKMTPPAPASDHKPSDATKRQSSSSSGNGFMSFFSFSGKKDTPPPQQEKSVSPKEHLPAQHTTSSGLPSNHSIPQVQVVQPQPTVTVSVQHQQAPTQQTVSADPPPRPRVASNPHIVPVEIQSQPNKPSAHGSDMFLGMSTVPSTATQTTPPTVQVNEPMAPVSVSPVKSIQSLPKKDVPVSPPRVSIKLNNADVCEKIKLLSAEVVTGFHAHVTQQAQLQLQLVQQGRALRVAMDSEEINGRRLQKLVEETEKEQLRLAEAEEFELADALSMKLEGYREAMISSTETVTRLQQEIIHNDEELISLRNKQSSLFDSTVKGLNNLLRQQKEEIDKYLSANQSRLREDDTRISAEEERVHMERSGVAREESALEEEKNEIEGVINSQTSEIEKDREDLEMRLMGVTAEIKNLEKMLETKRREELELKNELGVVEEKIGVVRKKYDRRLQRIHDRVIDLTSDSEACRKEEEVIQEQRRLFLEDKSLVEKTEKDIDSWLLWMEGEIEITSKLKTALENIRSHQEQETSDSMPSSASATVAGVDDHNELVVLKEQVSIAENEVNIAMSLVKSAQELVGKLMDEDADIAEKLPQLEAEKKAHASNKRFKEAGNIAKTIKTLSTRKEEIAEELQHSSSAISAAESELEMKKDQYDAALRELKEAERSADIIRLEALKVQIKELRKANRKAAKEIETLYPIGTNPVPHTTSAKDSEGHILQLSQIALCFLQTELESALSTANEIKEKHNLELSFDEEEDDDDDTVEMAEELITPNEDASSDVADDLDEKSGEEKVTDPSDERVVDQDLPPTETPENGDAPSNDSSAVQATDEPVNELDREASLQEAHELIELILSKESELEVAVDEEDYDRAAELSETIDTSKESLKLILQRISMTREEVIAHFTPQEA